MFAILAVSLSTRAWKLAVPFVFSDESFTWRVSRCDVPELLRRVADDTHPPGHFLILHGWMSTFGDSPAAIRGLSVAAGLLCVPLVFLLVREAVKHLESRNSRLVVWGGMLAAFLCAIHWTQIEPSRTARMYSLAALLGGISALLLLRSLRAQRHRALWWTAYGASVGAFLYTHNFAIFSVIAQACFVIGLVLYSLFVKDPNQASRPPHQIPSSETRDEIGPPPPRIVIVGYAWALSLAFLLYLPWLPAFLEQASRVRQSFWIRDLNLEGFGQFALGWAVGAGDNMSPARLTWISQVVQPVIPLVCLVLFWSIWKPTGARLFFLSQAAIPWLLTWLVSSLGDRPLFQVRYLVISHLFLLALFGATLPSLHNRLERWLFSVILIGPCLWVAMVQLVNTGSRPPVLEVAVAKLLEEYQEGDVIVVDRVSAVNCVKFYAAQLGVEDLSVRCHDCEPQWRGHVNHIASLEPADLLLWEIEDPPSDVRRVWIALDGTGQITSPASSGWNLVKAFNYSAEEYGVAYSLELYARDSG